MRFPLLIYIGLFLSCNKSAPTGTTSPDKATIVLSNLGYQEVSESAGVLKITATLSNANDRNTVLSINVAGTALSGADYLLSASSFNFPASAKNGDTLSLLISIIDNTILNYEKELKLTFTPSVNCANATQEKKVLIYDDETEPDPVPYAAPFTGVPDVANISMYEVNLRCFSNTGTLQGVQGRLDSIKALGINTIWLMPVYPVGSLRSINSPYCVKADKEVGAEYGSLDHLRTFVAEAHQRGISVMLDWVANHTSWDNPWINNKSWYTQDNTGTIVSPPGTNWADVADLNYNNYRMRQAMISAMKYWVLAANIDGYRCDAADMVPFDFWKQAIDTLKALPGRKLLMLAEGSRSDHFLAGFQINFGWDFFSTLKSVFKKEPPQTALSMCICQNTIVYPRAPLN